MIRIIALKVGIAHYLLGFEYKSANFIVFCLLYSVRRRAQNESTNGLVVPLLYCSVSELLGHLRYKWEAYPNS